MAGQSHDARNILFLSFFAILIVSSLATAQNIQKGDRGVFLVRFQGSTMNEESQCPPRDYFYDAKGKVSYTPYDQPITNPIIDKWEIVTSTNQNCRITSATSTTVNIQCVMPQHLCLSTIGTVLEFVGYLKNGGCYLRQDIVCGSTNICQYHGALVKSTGCKDGNVYACDIDHTWKPKESCALSDCKLAYYGRVREGGGYSSSPNYPVSTCGGASTTSPVIDLTPPAPPKFDCTVSGCPSGYYCASRADKQCYPYTPPAPTSRCEYWTRWKPGTAVIGVAFLNQKICFGNNISAGVTVTPALYTCSVGDKWVLDYECDSAGCQSVNTCSKKIVEVLPPTQPTQPIVQPTPPVSVQPTQPIISVDSDPIKSFMDSFLNIFSSIISWLSNLFGRR